MSDKDIGQWMRNEFDNLTFPPADVRTRVMATLHGHTKKRRLMLKPAILGALLAFCMLTPGVIYAASHLIKITVEEHATDVNAQFKVEVDAGGIVFHPNVTEKLLQFYREFPNREGINIFDYAKKFKTYDEVEAYLEYDLLQSPMLSGDNLMQKSIKLNVSAGDTLGTVWMSSHHKDLGIPVGYTLSITLFTDAVTNFHAYSVILASGYRYTSDVEVSSYTSPINKIKAEIAYVPDSNSATAAFVQDGVLYTVGINPNETTNDQIAKIKQIIDSFE